MKSHTEMIWFTKGAFLWFSRTYPCSIFEADEILLHDCYYPVNFMEYELLNVNIWWILKYSSHQKSLHICNISTWVDLGVNKQNKKGYAIHRFQDTILACPHNALVGHWINTCVWKQVSWIWLLWREFLWCNIFNMITSDTCICSKAIQIAYLKPRVVILPTSLSLTTNLALWELLVFNAQHH